MAKEPDTELHGLVSRHQKGDDQAGWLFVQHRKIQAIIRGRLRRYRQMMPWLSEDDLDDIQCGLLPQIFILLAKFKLSEQANDGRIISYFSRRIIGEADFLLKKITGMRQVQDETDKSKTYLKSFSQSMDGLEEVLPGTSGRVDDEVITGIEESRQDGLLEKLLQGLPDWSNDRVWLRCYILRLKGRTWAQIAKDIGYKQTDYTWLKDNTGRFVTRLKHRLFLMGEEVSYTICGIYTDASAVAISVLNSKDHKNDSVWSRSYETYADLDRVEAKLGDIFRQFHVSYVVLNEENYPSQAHVIAMRYLTKREAFVEEVDLGLFKGLLPRMPKSVGGIACTDDHQKSLLLAHIKRAHLDEFRSRSKHVGFD